MADSDPKKDEVTVENSSDSDDKLQRIPSADVDNAFEYLKSGNAEQATSIDEKSLIRKVDWRIVPIMFACYTMQFVDKVNINYAAVMGINQDLKLRGNQFSWCATAFFIAFLVAEVPTGYLLQKLPPAKYLGINVILWGITTACTAACTNFATLLTVRIFLGIFEASIAPCLIVITSMWYTKAEQAPRFSFWYCGLGIGQIFGGLVSFGFQHVDPKDFSGWRAMFIALGIITVVIGAWTALRLPDTPMTAAFLTEQERAYAIKRIESNQTGIRNNTFKVSHLVELAKDPQIYLLTLTTVLISISSGVITSYSATLIKNIGYKPKQAALLNMPSGIVSIFVTLLAGVFAGRSSQRGYWIAGLCVPGVLGGALMSFLKNHAKGGLLAGIYLVNAVVATLILIYAWISANISGHTKRIGANVLISGSFSIGNIIGPQTFQARDAPQYIPAKVAVLVTQGCGGIVALILRYYYVQMNKKKDQEEQELNAKGEVTKFENIEWMNLTDWENKTFRYVY